MAGPKAARATTPALWLGRRVAGMTNTPDEEAKLAAMREWLQQVSAALDVDHAVVEASIPTLLDLVRDVAHGPSRPGAPLTAFSVGLALAQVLSQPGAPAPETAIREVVARLDGPLEPYRR